MRENVAGSSGSLWHDRSHARKVERIASALRLRQSHRPLSLKKRSVSHQVPKAGDLKYTDERMDISDLDGILAIDRDRRLCVAEPGVTFADLVAATLPLGLAPVIVPELKTITIGGAVSGCSIESMSFIHGGFHDTCVEYEIVTARGDVVVCTPDNGHEFLFHMMHGSFGTLGILTRLTFKLIEAKPFVRLEHCRYECIEHYQQAIAAHADARDVDFLDGILHAPDELVLTRGRFVDDAPYAHRYDWVGVYYRSTRTRREDYMPTRDYYFRYDRGVTSVRPRSFIGRLLFGKMLGSTQVLWAAEKLPWLLPAEQPTVIIDVFVPMGKVEEFMRWYQDELGFFPLWCVPYRRVQHYPWLSDEFYARTRETLFLDLAIYGMRQRAGKNDHAIIEQKLLEIGGLKTLISHNYFSEADFWRIFNKRAYDEAKAVTDPDNIFRDLYTKTCRASRGLPPDDRR
jgi:FAD/FMN-containing dehydrogenase